MSIPFFFSDWISIAEQVSVSSTSEQQTTEQPSPACLQEVFHLLPNWLDAESSWNSDSLHPVIHAMLDLWTLGQSLMLQPSFTPMLDEALEKEDTYNVGMKSWSGSTTGIEASLGSLSGNGISYNGTSTATSTGTSIRSTVDLPIPPQTNPNDLTGLSHSLTTILGRHGGILVSDSFHGLPHQQLIRVIASLFITFLQSTSSDTIKNGLNRWTSIQIVILRLKLILALCMSLAISTTQDTLFIEGYFHSWFFHFEGEYQNDQNLSRESYDVDMSSEIGLSPVVSIDEQKMLVQLFFRFILYNSGIPESFKFVMSQMIVVPILISVIRHHSSFLPSAEFQQYFDELSQLSPDPTIRRTVRSLQESIDNGSHSNDEVLEAVTAYFEMTLNRHGRIGPVIHSRISITHIEDSGELQIEVLRLLRYLTELKGISSPIIPKLIRDENYLPCRVPKPQRTEIFWKLCTSDSFVVRHWAFHYIASSVQTSQKLNQLGSSTAPDLYELMNFIAVVSQSPEAETRQLCNHTVNALILSDIYNPSYDLARDLIHPLYEHVVSIEGAPPFFNILQLLSSIITSHQDKLYHSRSSIIPLCNLILGRIALSPSIETRRLILDLLLTLTFWDVSNQMVNSFFNVPT